MNTENILNFWRFLFQPTEEFRFYWVARKLRYTTVFTLNAWTIATKMVLLIGLLVDKPISISYEIMIKNCYKIQRKFGMQTFLISFNVRAGLS